MKRIPNIIKTPLNSFIIFLAVLLCVLSQAKDSKAAVIYKPTEFVTRDGNSLIFENGVRVEYTDNEPVFYVHLPEKKVEVRTSLWRVEYGRVIHNDPNRPQDIVPRMVSMDLGGAYIGTMSRIYIKNGNGLPDDYISHFGYAVLHNKNGGVVIVDPSKANIFQNQGSEPQGLKDFLSKMVETFEISGENVSTNFSSINSASSSGDLGIPTGCCCYGVDGSDKPALIIAFHGFESNSKNMKNLFQEDVLQNFLMKAGASKGCLEVEYIDYDTSWTGTSAWAEHFENYLDEKYGKKIQNKEYCRIKFAGHSLGGIIALKTMYRLQKNKAWGPMEVRTYATPLKGGMYTGSWTTCVEWASLFSFNLFSPVGGREVCHTFLPWEPAPLNVDVYHYRTSEKSDKVITDDSQKNPVPGNVYDKVHSNTHYGVVINMQDEIIEAELQDLEFCEIMAVKIDPLPDQVHVGPVYTPVSPGTGICGDGRTQSPNKYNRMEECDGGDLSKCEKGQSCDRYCKCSPNPCGNYQPDPGEDCDPPKSRCFVGKGKPGICQNDCSCKAITYCGDKNIDQPNTAGQMEECDPPGKDNAAGTKICSSECKWIPKPKPPICGNNTVETPPEDCDPPGSMCPPSFGAGQVCSSDCTCVDGELTFCGNGLVEQPNSLGQIEECDSIGQSDPNCSGGYCLPGCVCEYGYQNAPSM